MGGIVAGGFDPREAVTGIRGQQPRQVFGFGQGGPVRQRPAEIFAQPGTNIAGKGAGCFQGGGQSLAALSAKQKGFERSRLTRGVFPHQHEIARVRDQDETVAIPIAADLGGRCGQPSVVAGGFDFDHAAFRDLAFLGPAFLELLGGIQAEVGMTRPLGREFGHAERFGFQGCAHRIEQVGQGRIVRPFPGCPARGAYPAEVGQIGFDGGGQFGGRSGHSVCCG